MSEQGDPETDPTASILLGDEPEVLAAIWVTVDVERVLAQIGQAGQQLPDDPLLGASVTLVAAPDGNPIVLLEPRTEGRIAATLARGGEGPAGRYATPPGGLAGARLRAAAEGLSLSPEYDGPFGPSALVMDGPPAGPHLVLVDRPAGTIDR
jgi:hypothetical protein